MENKDKLKRLKRIEDYLQGWAEMQCALQEDWDCEDHDFDSTPRPEACDGKFKCICCKAKELLQ